MAHTLQHFSVPFVACRSVYVSLSHCVRMCVHEYVCMCVRVDVCVFVCACLCA